MQSNTQIYELLTRVCIYYCAQLWYTIIYQLWSNI